MSPELGWRALGTSCGLFFLLSWSGLAHAATYYLQTSPQLAPYLLGPGLYDQFGNPLNSLNGTPVTAVTSANGATQFFFAGDLTIGATDQIYVIGQLLPRGVSGPSSAPPAQFIVGNNLTIEPGAQIDASGGSWFTIGDAGQVVRLPLTTNSGPGGGQGGLGLNNSTPGGIGGSGGTGGTFGVGGPGLPPSSGGSLLAFPGTAGGAGNPSPALDSRSFGGPPGSNGLPGEPGVNSPYVAAGGAGGAGGQSTPSPQAGGAGGAGGSGGLNVFGSGGSAGGPGQPGNPGAAGASGQPGGNGMPGLNLGSGLLLSGGSGGGGGGAGGNGQGGMGGSGGGGGGGGGAGGFISPDLIPGGDLVCLIGNCSGGNGGWGGVGGNGGSGGNGGDGGIGGNGGGGGGALEIFVRGRLQGVGQVSATGGVPEAGTLGSPGLTGSAGSPGSGPIASPGTPAPGGDGGAGGAGGGGGAGGPGGAGAPGGAGGGGAGGTVALVASNIAATSNGVVRVGGGNNSGVGAGGGPGRFIVGTNQVVAGTNAASVFGGAIIGAGTSTTFAGPRIINPFIIGATVLTPYIPDLVGGADGFGLLPGSLANPILTFALARTPAHGKAALMLLPNGVDGLSDPGYDLLVLVDTLSNDLTNPLFGVGGATQLLLGGWQNDPLFGGHGAQLLPELSLGQVYGTLVPEGSHDFCFSVLNNAGQCFDSLAYFDPQFAIPEPSTLALSGSAIFLYLLYRRKMGRSASSRNSDRRREQ